MKPSRTEGALALAFSFLLTGTATAQVPTSLEDRSDTESVRESATFLLVPVGPRTVGLGGAAAAARGDVEGSLWNPAALAGLERSALFGAGASEFGATARILGGVLAWADLRVGLTYFQYDLGRIDARDAANQDIGSIEPNHSALILSAAYPVTGWLELGGSWKLIRLASGCSGGCGSFDDTGTGSAFDLGAIARLPGLRGVRAGLLVRNLGSGIGFGGGAPDPLPTRGRIGLEVSLPEAVSASPGWADGQLALRVRLDLQETLTEFDDLDVHAGLEIGWRGILFARAGYAASSEGRSGPTLGLGLRWKRLHLDLAHAFDDFSRYQGGTPIQLALGIGI